ncbi:tRNA (guanine-N(7)-)-methyltransferase (tRNA(m7G46)-methyltransferase) [Mycoemilia scoparia]|uniref:tRNA (Guanine-N(7)-)-methyltransferase (tRNA(m7G46)-methyltransferase) n=1 Tax=Mycoemilia scoparia TaxID=417184 RepID=A0A9W7ZXW4_9FUNG|nr:tRNA (guanine-N(7)-)-methyltransferase (tRNA(m7G46)-methyltransferase) [Mycoemilia scoparia]
MLAVELLEVTTLWLKSILSYALLFPFLVASLCIVLLFTNIVTSYWYHRRLSILGPSTYSHARSEGEKKPGIVLFDVAGTNPFSIGSFGTSPPVRRIPVLDFARKDGSLRLDSSFFPTKYTRSYWVDKMDRSIEPEELANELAILPFLPSTERALQNLLDLVVRDFIQSWFRTISADPSFGQSVKAEIASILRHVVVRVEKLDLSHFFMARIVPAISRHLHDYRRAEKAATENTSPVTRSGRSNTIQGLSLSSSKGGKRPRSKTVNAGNSEATSAAEQESTNLLIIDNYFKLRQHPALRSLISNPPGASVASSEKNSHPNHSEKPKPRSKSGESKEEMLDQEKIAIANYLRSIVDELLELIIAKESLNFGPHKTIIREILASTLLTSVVGAVIDPDTSNRLIDMQLTRIIEEQRMVTKLRQALDLQSGGIGSQEGDLGDGKGFQPTRTFEEFIEMIKTCQDLGMLTSISENIVSQIRKKRILIMGKNKGDIVHGENVKDMIFYINRLYVAKKVAEKRIRLLSQNQGAQVPIRLSYSVDGGPIPRNNTVNTTKTSRHSVYYEQRDDPVTISPPQFSLIEIITDVSALSAFAEYMDLIGKSFILEYWLNIEGLKKAPNNGVPIITPTVINSLWKMYFTLRVDELGASEDVISPVQKLLKPYRMSNVLDIDLEKAGQEVLDKSFDLMCRVQNDLFHKIEQREYPNFLRSTLYRRFLSTYVMTSHKTHVQNQLFAPGSTQSVQTNISLDQSNIGSSANSIADSMANPAGTNTSAPARTLTRESSMVPKVSNALYTISEDDPRGSGEPIANDIHPQVSGKLASGDNVPRDDTLAQGGYHSYLDMFGNWGSSLFKSGSQGDAEPKIQPIGEEPKDLAQSDKQDLEDFPQDATDAANIQDSDLLSSHQVDAVEAVLDGMLHKNENMESSGTSAPPRIPGDSTSDQALFYTPKTSRTFGISKAFSSMDKGRARSTNDLRALGLKSLEPLSGKDGPVKTNARSLSKDFEPTLADSTQISLKSKTELLEEEDISDEEDLSVYDDNSDVSDLDIGSSMDSYSHSSYKTAQKSVQVASLGDLFLSERAFGLNALIDTKRQQIAIVNALLVRVESKGQENEQRILKASQVQLIKETKQLLNQRKEYETQALENKLVPSRTLIRIPRTSISAPIIPPKDKQRNPSTSIRSQIGSRMKDAINPLRRPSFLSGSPTLLGIRRSPGLKGRSPELITRKSGKKYVQYSIEVLKTDINGKIKYSWIITHRYREFLELHEKMKALFPEMMKHNEFPAKNPFLKFKKSHIESRRAALESYLNRLIQHNDACRSVPLRLFLSQHPPPKQETLPDIQNPASATANPATLDNNDPWMGQLYESISRDINDITGDGTMLDKITKQLSAQIAKGDPDVLHPDAENAQTDSQSATSPPDDGYSDSLSFLSSYVSTAGSVEVSTPTYANLSEPLCDLFIEIFELKDKNNWLRRQAINILLRHIFGGAMERRVKDIVTSLVSESQLANHLTEVTNIFWPHQQKFTAPVPRTDSERSDTYQKAQQKLLFYLPNVLGSMVGRKNAEKGATRLLEVLQHRRLNLQLVLYVLDDLVLELFPELRRGSSNSQKNSGNFGIGSPFASPSVSPLARPVQRNFSPLPRSRLNTF